MQLPPCGGFTAEKTIQGVQESEAGIFSLVHMLVPVSGPL